MSKKPNGPDQPAFDSSFAPKPKPAKPPKPKPEPSGDPGVKQAITRFEDGLLQRHGIKPDPRPWGRFAREIKQLITAWGIDEVLGLVDDFFASRDPHILRSQYTQSDFLNNIQRLRMHRAGSVAQDERTQANLDAGHRAMQRR